LLTTVSIKVGKTKSGLSTELCVIAIVLFSAACTPVMAAQITVVTSVNVKGNFQEHSSFAHEGGGGIVGASEDTMAISGTTTYEKTEEIDTSGQNIAGNNVKTDRIIEFNATPGTGGRMVSDESVIVGSVGGSSSDPACGSVGGSGSSSSAGVSIVIAGSSMDVTEVSVHSSSSATAITDTPGTPVSLDYSFSAQGINQTPGDLSTGAVGSASVYVSANIQTGDANATAPDSKTEYHEITSVDGLFELAKSISYSSAPK
jgi:hypothetical protein